MDLTELFPELTDFARTATRLHPRPGVPEVTDSSVGGPFLWPADEAWPVCREQHDDVTDLQRPDDERLRRRVLADGYSRTGPGQRLQLTDQERADLARIDRELVAGVGLPPFPMMAVAQLFARDVPDLVCPEGADLLQVLWCPIDHEAGCPRVLLKWRNSGDVVHVLPDQPEPPLMEMNTYLPEPCVLHPERVVECQYADLLPEKLRERIEEWEEATDHSYQDLSIAHGWKVGGWASWHLTDPCPMDCECGQEMRLLLTIASSEWDAGYTWRPIEDEPTGTDPIYPRTDEPTMITIGRGYSLWIFVCPRSYDHPHQMSMQ
ncbi:hypothetical protein [Acrocarpospora sp. B8E8]|uniref:hypothetical protein n=1 Tax=Acrocarpospora sp. B8E8 TaxID=3153572 RepID=UPI00325F9E4A